MIEHTLPGRAIRLLLACGGLLMASALLLGAILFPASAFAAPHSALWTPTIAALHVAGWMMRAGLVVAGAGLAACLAVLAAPARYLSRLSPGQSPPGAPSAPR